VSSDAEIEYSNAKAIRGQCVLSTRNNLQAYEAYDVTLSQRIEYTSSMAASYDANNVNAPHEKNVANLSIRPCRYVGGRHNFS